MHSFCTLFDANYLVKGLTMYNSLLRSGDPFSLYIFCFDDLTHQILRKMGLANVVLITLKEFETEELKRVKQERSRGEYCWTCTPHVIRFALDTYGLSQITYLDADIYFYSSPGVLLDEIESSGGSVLITGHRYTPKYDQSKEHGIYCVQFITFKGDAHGLHILQWWQDRCLEWCYARLEDGKFGDQKYLDSWTSRFQGVHVLEHLGGGVAPWNVQQYRVTKGPSVNSVPVIFYHFHYLTWYYNGRFDLGSYKISKKVKQYIYGPYLSALENTLKQIKSVFGDFSPGRVEFKKPSFHMLRILKRKIDGRHNVIQK
jgi:hypothetical protein